MIYSYKCKQCNHETDSKHRGDTLATHNIWCQCGGEYRRRFIIRTDAVIQEHFNNTLQRPISSNKQFDEALKVESARASLQTGMEHRYERVDPTDRKTLGVTEQGIDQSNRVRTAQGLPTLKV